MRKLFYLLLALPLAFAACTEKPAPEPAPEPQPDPKPDPKPEYVMDMAFAAAARIPSADVDLEDTYYQLCFVDDAELYEFSLLLSGEDAVLTAGEYEPESADLHNIETEAIVEFAEGNVTVGLEGDIYSFEMVLADAEGALYRFTYKGTVLDMEPAETPEPPVGDEFVFNATFFGGEYYAPEDDITTHNYFCVLSDVLVEGSMAKYPANYFYFDFYSNEVNESYTIPNGVYTFDLDNSCAAGTSAEGYTYGFTTDEEGDLEWHTYQSGVITVTDGKIVAEMVREDGLKMTITYEGNLSLAPSTGGGNGMSTLEGDLELNATGWTHLAQYYGDYYTADTDNWFVEIYEEGPNTGNGGYLLLDLLVDPSNDDWRGTYTVLTDLSDAKGKFIAGGVDEEGYMVGCWYAELADGGIGGAMAPIVDGTITVTAGENGAMTIAYDCVDDNGNKITGSVAADAYAGGYSAKALNAQAKKSQVSVKKQKVNFRR